MLIPIRLKNATSATIVWSGDSNLFVSYAVRVRPFISVISTIPKVEFQRELLPGRPINC